MKIEDYDERQLNQDETLVLKFEFFKKFNYHFLPMYGNEITIEQATELAKAGGSCGGPYWPVRQSPNDKTKKFEMEAKRVAFKLRAEFRVVNELPPHPEWWMKNKIYIRWVEHMSNSKKRRYKINKRPALVVSINDNFKVFYDWDELEKKVNDFKLKALYT